MRTYPVSPEDEVHLAAVEALGFAIVHSPGRGGDADYYRGEASGAFGTRSIASHTIVGLLKAATFEREKLDHQIQRDFDTTIETDQSRSGNTTHAHKDDPVKGPSE